MRASEVMQQAREAFRKDDAAGVRELLERYPALKAGINEPFAAFDAPAIVRVRGREMLDVLLAAGADINAKSRWWAGGFGLLHLASPELAAYAIERGAVADVHAAARLGMFAKLKELIAGNSELVHARGGDGQTPLHFASTLEVAEYLLDHGADIDMRDVDHESTPAQYMVRDRQEIARYLVARGCTTDLLMAAALGNLELARQHLDADPACIRMSVGEESFPKQDPRAGGTIYIWTLGHHKTAHLVAREFGHEDVFRLLMERSPEELKLALACELGDESTLQMLLARRPDLVRTLSEDDRRKLPRAAENNNTEAVRLMLAAGWPVDARGRHGGTALHWAAFHGNLEAIRLILGYSPALEMRDADFNATPLGWATHGSEHGWFPQTGNYAGAADALVKAGAALPEKVEGTQAVREVLLQRGAGR
ncbi:MAG TPA: ankyrin repeat domain-containing protein [Dongiaceae bacterium]|nr:ankyrin repeat domain-containing protein [Dongiaceae bacterium]